MSEPKSKNTKDNEQNKFENDLDGNVATRIKRIDTYGNKAAILLELEARGVDITLEPLLVNNDGITITLNNGNLIYTE